MLGARLTKSKCWSTDTLTKLEASSASNISFRCRAAVPTAGYPMAFHRNALQFFADVLGRRLGAACVACGTQAFLPVRPARLLARCDWMVKQAGMPVWRTGWKACV